MNRIASFQFNSRQSDLENIFLRFVQMFVFSLRILLIIILLSHTRCELLLRQESDRINKVSSYHSFYLFEYFCKFISGLSRYIYE